MRTVQPSDRATRDLVVLAARGSLPAHARCVAGTRIISRGDTSRQVARVLRRAGEPCRRRRRAHAPSYSELRRFLPGFVEDVWIEEWTYNLGPNQLIRMCGSRTAWSPSPPARLRLLAYLRVQRRRAAAAPAPSRSRSPHAFPDRESACRAESNRSCAPSRSNSSCDSTGSSTTRPSGVSNEPLRALAELPGVPTLVARLAEHERDHFELPSMGARLLSQPAIRHGISNLRATNVRRGTNQRLTSSRVNRVTVT